ncbi:MAG TPA: heparinase II/III family protein, partial [Sporichthya sp.]|nr:heparinase II/III family protein [Sporichthya sp.]
IRQGVLRLSGFAPAKLKLDGDVNWYADPFDDPTWQLWFHSLKWMESLVVSGNPTDLQLARRIVADFVHDRPDPGSNTGAWDDHATALRTSLLVCMYQRGDAALRSWIRPIIRAHAGVLINRYAGAYNHGTMQSLALLASGCALGNPDWRTLAASRLGNELRREIDAQGAISEQAPGYSPFIQRLHREGLAHLAACGMPVPPGAAERLAAVDTFAAHATRPGGTFLEIGDTWPDHPSGMGPHTRWIATGGAKGTMPEELVKAYKAGYVFGRDSWVDTGQEYSLRYGPGRYVHGHNDHLAMTYWAAGHDVLVDSGYAGYASDSFREWSRSLAAHNVPVVKDARFSTNASTRLVGRSATADTHTWQLRDSAFSGVERHRTVLVDDAMRLMLVRDDVTSRSKHGLQISWHLDPSWRKEAVVNRPGTSRATFLSKDGSLRATVLQIAAPGQRLPQKAATLERGYVSRSRNDKTRDWVVDAHRRAATRQSVFTLVLVTPVNVPVTATRAQAGHGVRLSVTVGTTTRTYVSTRRGGMTPA